MQHMITDRYGDLLELTGRFVTDGIQMTGVVILVTYISPII